MHNDGWIGVDLDGTLAVYDSWRGVNHIGEPVKPMVERVKTWLKEGKQVRIFTARVFAPTDDAMRQRDAAISMINIGIWCQQHLGQILPITCSKDFGMIELWDDRCVTVIPNKGIPWTEQESAT